ncbi:cytochrome b/b6 domain-containing protein [Pseudohalocynthiibacter aestuariivivens]|uniref:Cytochrome b/b6 domain-containing protein n=1 Tax=Pseudohalocynthiibacter aestuariivivens TaxID=1591409 RepID=A0ABV5JIZ8_9RHOB|nr:cytochrome b/b6 domain-containing protein [Pseudohalocynthiibacter aestuariivivens]MBS9716593.1 cytochrome b/b6 domain-containing protein [Pseudohalocynthiibacter aestuariivivens]
MALQNTSTRFGAVTKIFHWLTALLILTLIPLGIIAHGAPFSTGEEIAFKALLFSIHKTLGVTAFFVALTRILWALTQPKPRLLNADHKAEAFLAETIHWLLYSALLLVPLTGWIHHAATTGFAPIWWPFGQELPFVPKDTHLAHLFASLHFSFERVLAFSVLLHIAGAVKHHLIDKDATLRRMLPGQPPLPALLPDHKNRLPILGAVAVYPFALTVGAFLWYFPGLETVEVTPTTELEESSGNWKVSEGTLSLTIKQFGSDVTGEFGEWSADITFDDTPGLQNPGSVKVTVNTTSLSLGSVTDQAMGPDFFDVQNHPQAVFLAKIFPVPDGYVAEGTLTLKGIEVPITLPFSLRIEEDAVRMNANTTLQRLDFGIGSNMPDESSLGFSVGVSIELNALRND